VYDLPKINLNNEKQNSGYSSRQTSLELRL